VAGPFRSLLAGFNRSLTAKAMQDLKDNGNPLINIGKRYMPANHHVSPLEYAQALARQKALSDEAWLWRCDELAVEQRVLFLELLIFARDGLPAQQLKSLINYLSVLQSISAAISKSASAPVLLPEFQAAVKRAMLFFHAIKTDDRAHFDRMVKAFHDSTITQTEPIIWAGCIETLREPGILTHPLLNDIVVTLYAIADVFSRRL
jgi:hypothetical protein